jgi:Protein of unknown function (DUF2510)/Protein of unknown function (DUF3592)
VPRDELENVGFWVLWVGIFVTVGIGFVIRTRQLSRRVERLRRSGFRTSAVVVDYEYRRDEDGDQIPYPLVRFQRPDGRLVTAGTDFGGSFVPAIGEVVEVLFDPERPAEVHIDSRHYDRVNRVMGWVGWGMIVVVALVAATVGLLFWPMAVVIGLLVAGVILAVMVAVRRRRPDRQARASAAQARPWGQGTVPVGWFADPRRRHELRYWDGQRWTEHVFDRGTQAVDPL